MTERSMFWSDSVGDGGPYSQDQLRLLWKALSIAPGANEGVLPGQLNEFQIKTTGNNNVTIGTGRALVDGTLYENDASASQTITSPSVGTTGKRVVLRKSWSARTVRITVISSADGTSSLPSLTQTDGTTWDVPICSFTITTGGVIGSLTDEREWVSLGFDTAASVRHRGYERAVICESEFAHLFADGAGDPYSGSIGLVATGAAARYTASSDPSNGKLDLSTSTTSAARCGFRSGLAAFKGSLNPRLVCSLIPQAANAALAIQFWGFFSATAAAAGTGNSKVGFRSTTTGNVFAVTGDGSTEATTDLGVAPTSQTTYEVRTDDAGVTWDFYVNGVRRASHTTPIPLAATTMYAMLEILNNTTTAMIITSADYLFADQNRS